MSVTPLKAKLPHDVKDEQELMTDMFSPEIADDPLAFVLFAFPWGKKGTPLENWQGPREWQKNILIQMRDHIKNNRLRMEMGEMPEILRVSIASGRGIGKSALVAWLNLWTMSTVLGATCITTANTENQLKSKTWAELGKWHTLAINSHWFERNAMSLKAAPWFEEAIKSQLKIDTAYYYAQAQLWSEENPDAFAGIHNMYGVLVIMDEASGIPAPIWKVTEGFFTEPVLHRYWVVMSNPRRNTGAFYECFHSDRERWARRNIDSRSVEGLDHKYLQGFADKYGEDSDETRVEVRGEFPRQGDNQFISRELVSAAVQRELVEDIYAPLIMGVDPARYGDDSTVIRFRQGRNGKVLPPVVMKGADNMQVANRCAELIDKYEPDAVCVDAGNGTGIIDRLKELGYKVHEVWFGKKADSEEWANKRTEIWAKMRDWLNGACIDASRELIDDLTSPEYGFQKNSDKLRLETKEELKARGLASPDHGDALACTFWVNIPRRDSKLSRKNGSRKQAINMDYKIFS